jgi:hypothetical protein
MAIEAQIRASLDAVATEGRGVLYSALAQHAPQNLKGATKDQLEVYKKINIKKNYQSFYTKSLRLISTIAPERLLDFSNEYKIDKNRKGLSWTNYKIEDFLMNTQNMYDKIDVISSFSTRIENQISIIESIVSLVDSKIGNIFSDISYQIIESEISAAEELMKVGFLRASGVLAGVLLERHIGNVLKSHNVILPKKKPTLSDFNDALREAEIIDTPDWRSIQRFGDIRNLCAHPKDRDPTKQEIIDIVSGTKKYIVELR